MFIRVLTATEGWGRKLQLAEVVLTYRYYNILVIAINQALGPAKDSRKQQAIPDSDMCVCV